MKSSYSSIDTSWIDDQITIESTDTMTSYIYSTNPTGNVTIGNVSTGASGQWLTTTGASNTAFGYTSSGSNGTWGNVTSTSPSSTIEIKGEDADVVINGKSLSKFMETMESRLAILQPDLEKLEHFSALKKAYDHYKALEALCELPKKDDDNT